jgi:hypothetical protein
VTVQPERIQPFSGNALHRFWMPRPQSQLAHADDWSVSVPARRPNA